LTDSGRIVTMGAMRERDIEVIVLSDEPVITHYAFRRAPRWPVRSAGLAATILVHLLLTAPMVLGYAAHNRRAPPHDGPGSVNWASQGEQNESMILLDLSSTQIDTAETFVEPRIDSPGIKLEEPVLALVSLDPTPPNNPKLEKAEESDISNVAAGDPAGAAALFGRYMGQVAARIERAWMRPRSAVEGGIFTCRARITQDRAGNVLSMQLQDCGNDGAWRKSLTSAILRASPLSAPPEPWLFTSTITLNFSGDQYVAGQTPEYAYEPAPLRVATSRVEGTSADSPITREPGDYELTITGSEVHWTKKQATVATHD
jgi:hypothetical protein